MQRGEPSGNLTTSFTAGVAIATGAAVAVYKVLAPKDITLIEILPDYPAGGEAKPTNKDQSLNTTTSGEPLPPSLFEESSSERFRRQARQAVMRQDLPLDLSSRPVHEPSSGID